MAITPFAPEIIGNNVHLEVAAPGAGANLSVVLPTTPNAGTLWILDFVRFLFTTDATVVSRSVALATRNVANTLNVYEMNTLLTTVQLASVANSWLWYRNLPLREYPVESNQLRVWMPTVILLPGERLVTSIANLQAGDALTNVIVCYREYRVTA